MTQQLVRCDVNEADEAEQRRLERHPESRRGGWILDNCHANIKSMGHSTGLILERNDK